MLLKLWGRSAYMQMHALSCSPTFSVNKSYYSSIPVIPKHTNLSEAFTCMGENLLVVCSSVQVSYTKDGSYWDHKHSNSLKAAVSSIDVWSSDELYHMSLRAIQYSHQRYKSSFTKFGELPETIQTQGVCSDVEAVEVVEELMKRGLWVVLPGLEPVWRSLEPVLVHEFLWDVEILAERLVEFKSWFPAADADRVVAKQAVIMSRVDTCTGCCSFIQGTALSFRVLLRHFYPCSSYIQHIMRIPCTAQQSYNIPCTTQQSYNIPCTAQQSYNMLSVNWWNLSRSSCWLMYMRSLHSYTVHVIVCSPDWEDRIALEERKHRRLAMCFC